MKKIKLIESQQEFDELCAYLKLKTHIAIDTEFERRYTYFAKLSLIQIGVSADEIYIVDVLKFSDISSLKDILLDDKITKIIHSLYQDIEIFYHLFHSAPVKLYDTQTAAEAAGYGKSISYFELVKQICNVTLNKEMQKCDWIQRPLSDAQIDYASFDVEFLFKIYSHLEFQIDKLCKRELFKSMMIKHHHPKTYAINYEDAWKKASFPNKSESFSDKMRMLAALREELASLENVPRGHFIHDRDLVRICEKLPTTIQALDELNIRSHSLKKLKYKTRIITLCAAFL